MPFRPVRLALWVLFGNFMILELRQALIARDPWFGLQDLMDSHLLLLTLAGLIVFYGFAICQYYLLYRGYQKLHRMVFIGLQALLVPTCVLLRASIEEGLIKSVTGRGNYNPNMSWWIYFVDNLYYILVFCGIGAIYYFFQLAGYSISQRQRSEILRREAELKFLRSQVNPHFLFNTFNNLYSLVNIGSSRALPVLDKLSGLLRYALYEQAPTVTLARELSYLYDLIELESLRLPDVAPPVIEIAPLTANWQLPPLLLVPFVENACKHGDLSRPDAPLTIRIGETVAGLSLRFSNATTSKSALRDSVGGIGLENVRKRLILLYPGRHEFRAGLVNDLFVVDLVLRTESPQASRTPEQSTRASFGGPLQALTIDHLNPARS